MARPASPFLLSKKDFFCLELILNEAKKTADEIKRGKILYHSHMGEEPFKIAMEVDVTVSTVYGVRKRYREGGLDGALYMKRTFKKISIETQQYIIKLLCEPAPEGLRRWSASLIVKELEKINVVVTIEAVRLVFKKLNINPKFPQKHNG